jgi:hypothetical protein
MRHAGGRVNRASQWKKKAAEAAEQEAVTLELPSGMIIRARRPDPMQLAAWDKLPMSLAAAAQAEDAEHGSAPQVTNDQAAEMAVFLRDLLIYCCVDPRVSLAPKDDEIHPKDIPQGDWIFILNWAMRAEEARALQGFRSRRADAGNRGDSKAVLDKTF